jgi:hypothetical protein
MEPERQRDALCLLSLLTGVVFPNSSLHTYRDGIQNSTSSLSYQRKKHPRHISAVDDDQCARLYCFLHERNMAKRDLLANQGFSWQFGFCPKGLTTPFKHHVTSATAVSPICSRAQYPARFLSPQCGFTLHGARADGDAPAVERIQPTSAHHFRGERPVLECGRGQALSRTVSLCWLLVTSVQKNREMCQEHHEGTTLSCWLQEPSTEKSGSDLFRNLLFCCFFGEKSARHEEILLRSGERSSRERHRRLVCRRHLRNTGNETEGLQLPG